MLFLLLLLVTVVSAEQAPLVAIRDVPAILFTRDYTTTFNPKQPQIVCKGKCENVPEAILCTNQRKNENGYATWKCSSPIENLNFEFGSIECAFARETIVFQDSCWIVISIEPEPEPEPKPEPEPEPKQKDNHGNIIICVLMATVSTFFSLLDLNLYSTIHLIIGVSTICLLFPYI